MTIDILTIFPEMFDSVLNTSILGRAREKGLITIETTDIRPFSVMKHKNTDDYPFGGGAGMLMTPQPIADAIKAVCMKRGVPCIDRMTDNDENIAFVDNGELIADREMNMNAMPDKAYDVRQDSDTDHEADEAAENGNVLKENDMYSVGDSLLNDRVSLNVADATEIYNESDQYHKREDSRNAGIFDAVRPINSLIAEHLTVSAENIADKAGIDAAEADQQDDLFAAGKNETVPGVEKKVKRIYLSPRGVPFTQRIAEELAKEDELILLCGHYEGVDQRVLDKYIDMEISVGDYVLTGGELGAMIIADCVARLLPGVLGSEESPQDESFSVSGLLEYPQYTRPRVFEGMEVPEVLLNGDHAKIAAWRREQAILETQKRRPELLLNADLTDKEKRKYLIDMGNYQ